jgi:hypothetical protein
VALMPTEVTLVDMMAELAALEDPKARLVKERRSRRHTSASFARSPSG